MAREVLLPKVGLTMEEGVIEEWLVQPGERVETGRPLLIMATDKVDVEVEAESNGIFYPIVNVGASFKPGAIIGWLLEEGENIPGDESTLTIIEVEPQMPVAASLRTSLSEVETSNAMSTGRLLASPNAKRLAKLAGIDLHGVKGTGPDGRILSEDIEAIAQTPELHFDSTSAVVQSHTSRVASPLVRQLARALSVDVASVPGSGSGGVVTRADVHRAAAVTATISTINADTLRIIPMKGMRAAIARNMTASLQEMAQLTHGYEADVTELVRFREQMKQQLGPEAGRIPTVTDFIAQAVVRGLAQHPELNASVREDGIHVLEQVHLGFAVALTNGLVAPIVRNAHQLSLLDISAESLRLSKAAKEGGLAPDDLAGGTFAITTLGTYGVDFFTPVINPGNVAILGIGRIRDGVRWENDQPKRTDVLTLSLTFDHRAVDGAPAAEFLRFICELLRNPLALMVE